FKSVIVYQFQETKEREVPVGHPGSEETTTQVQQIWKKFDQIDCTGKRLVAPHIYQARGGWVNFYLQHQVNRSIDPDELYTLEKMLKKEKAKLSFSQGEDAEYKKMIYFDFADSLQNFYFVTADQFLCWW